MIQSQVHRLWTDERIEAQIAEAARRYTERRETLVAALAARGIAAQGVSGINVWIPVPEEAVVVSGLLAAGWAVAPGAWFRVATPPGVRITVSNLNPRDMEPLADALTAVLNASGSGSAV
jgi:DNA-binding transcriptional MocR family regulator